MSKMPDDKTVNRFFSRTLTIVGGFATAISCIIAFLTFVMPQKVGDTIIQIYSIPTPSPQVIIVTAPISELPLNAQPTLSPSPQSSSTPNIISFNDDFEKGIKPDWDIVYGKLGMANGKFTVTSLFEGRQDFHMAILDNIAWSNIRIEVILAEFRPYMRCFPCDVSASSGVIIRYDPNGQTVGLLLLASQGKIAFATLDNKNTWSIISSTVAGGDGTIEFWSHPNKIVIEAIGDTYFASIDGQQLTSVTLPGLTSGQVGLWFANSSSESQVNAFAARYESFSVQELP